MHRRCDHSGPHTASDADTNGGFYHWQNIGEVPPLPDVLRAMLSEAVEHAEPKTPAELTEFLQKHAGEEQITAYKGI